METMKTSAVPNPSVQQSLPDLPIAYERFLDCVHCGLCTAACPTYIETGDENNSPRGRIYLMRAVVDGRVTLTDRVREHLDLCLDCRSCETACPSGVQYGRLLEPFRVAMHEGALAASIASSQLGAPADRNESWFERWILNHLFPYPRRLARALLPMRILQRLGWDRWLPRVPGWKLLPEPLRRMHGLLPRLTPPLPALPEYLPAQGKRRATVVLFKGCVADVLYRHVHWATARVLQANGCDVLVPREQGCCGAIQYHHGAGASALNFLRKNVQALAKYDYDALIVNVAGCGSILKDYAHVAAELRLSPQELQLFERFADRVQDISEFLDRLGPRPPRGSIPYKVVYHDACHLVHAQRLREPPRRLLAFVPGLQIMPLAESEICCGAAGSYNLTHPDMADRLGRRKVQQILATGAQAVLSPNAGCSLHLGALLRQHADTLPIWHPVEVLDWSYREILPPRLSAAASRE
ncbi:MAG: glycolate oxidase iron-sulfur subunit [Planctomycetaceae bacterium]|nr:MAG: glycolate oxidase iron-sulfur subunit [Planctomycetaceae bacterium]